MSEQPILQSVFRIFTHFGLSAVAFAGAWWIWDWSRYDLWMFKLYAGLFALGGVIRLGKGLVELVKFLWQRRQWKKYQTKGRAQKADKTANVADLKSRGLIK